MAEFERNDRVAEPAAVPIRDAATVMIVADRPELEVLMVQRTRRAVFGANAWVFPGGRVDADDEADIAHVAHGLSDEQASAMLEVPKHGLSWWLAAVRETVEEAGLLLGVGGAATASVTEVRDAVHRDSGALIEALEAHGLSLDLSVLADVAQFTTPEGPPRRFNTRFFLAEAPAEQVASHDEEEVVQHCWIRPTDAIEQWRAGDFPMMSVTHRMLACLARYANVSAVLAAAQERRTPQHVRVDDPEGEYIVLLPGDEGYDDAEVEIEHGWVRI